MRRTALIIILVAAAAARLWFLMAGVPHAVGIDEPQVIDRAIRILRTGDWNTHLFDYPTLVIYFHAAVAIVRFLWGAMSGQWSSLDGFTIAAIYGSGRIAAALIGVATVCLVYKLGAELVSKSAGLLAAAQLAVQPMHVRESHFILTDVPMAALTTLAMWLTARAMRLNSIRAYAWAGMACGLAAAAKYNGGLAFVAVLAAWIISERDAPDRGRKLGAATGAAAVAFLLAAPYTVLDLPAFLDGFAAQFWRFSAPISAGDPAWLLYVKHLSPSGSRLTLPLALAGMILLLWRPRTRPASAPIVIFSLAFFYLLSSHSHVFGRYVLPLLPLIALFSAVTILELVGELRRIPASSAPALQPVLLGAMVVALMWSPVVDTVEWLDHLKRADTRSMAAEWLKTNTPKGARVAVENSGPTYLDADGFNVVGTELMLEHPAEWYRARVDYLVISAADLSRYGDYLAAGRTVLQIPVTPQRWGPPIQIIALR